MSDVIGIQAVRSVLAENPARARCLYLQRGRRDARVNELIGMARTAGVRFQSVEGAWFHRRVSAGAHQGVLLECHELALLGENALYEQWHQLPEPPLLLIVDGVTDPRNLGACLRTANAAGVDAVLLPKRRSAPLSPVALKAAQGGVEGLLLVEVTNLARAMRELRQRGVWLVGAAGDADDAYTRIDHRGPLALVVGSEDKGLRRLTREHCDQLVHIPMRGTVTSLNVSVATGVLLFELQRRRVAD